MVLRHVKRMSGFSGAVRVSFKIAADGAVMRSKVVAPGAFARLIAPCVERRARHVRFPAFTGDEAVTREAKFLL